MDIAVNSGFFFFGSNGPYANRTLSWYTFKTILERWIGLLKNGSLP